MRRIFSASMPRAGHHVGKMVLGRLLGSKFVYCEFHTSPGCCKRIPIARLEEHTGAGAAVFMHKSYDHALADPAPAAFDGIMVQVREPVARALANYELHLATVAPPHSPSYLRYWLGLEAA